MRAQGARTFLEKQFDGELLPDASAEDLLKYAVQSLKETVRTKKTKLNVDNTALAIVGINTPFRVLSESEVEPYVLAVEAEDVEEDGEDGDDGDDGEGGDGADKGGEGTDKGAKEAAMDV